MLDHDTWIFNLTAANAAGASQTPHWFKEYSFRDEYNVTSLSPAVLGSALNTHWTEGVGLRTVRVHYYEHLNCRSQTKSMVF